MQRQAGVVGVLQSVLKLHLHRQAPTWAANHIRLLSAGENTANVRFRATSETREQKSIISPDLDPEMSM